MLFEELLQRFRNHALPVTEERMTLLLRSLDAMRQMVPEAIAGAEELQAHHLELLNRLASGDTAEREKFATGQLAAPAFRPAPSRRSRMDGALRHDSR